jgi:hypothetical protein
VANTLNLFRNGASLLANSFGVAFIDWLGLKAPIVANGYFIIWSAATGKPVYHCFELRSLVIRACDRSF